MSALQGQLQFIIQADKMKNVMRQTLLLDKSREESDAEHSWHLALAALTLYEHVGIPGVDIARVVKMAVLHDLVEIYAGDTPAFDTVGNEDKLQRELDAADKLFSTLPPEQAEEYKAMWLEFDAMQTPDAIYAAAVDCFLPFLSNTLTNGHSWVKFNVKASQVYKRIAPVKTAIPALWDMVVQNINDAIQAGYIINDGGEDTCQI